jgi:hypothetical protein
MTLLRQIHKAQAQEPPPAAAEAAHEYEPIPMSPTTTSSTSSLTQLQPQTLQSNNSNKEDSDGDDDGRVYSNIPEELDQEDLYAEIDQTDPPTPSEGATTPEELDSNEEDNLDPNEMQLRLLLQIQKMVQKMEDVYGIASPKATRRQAKKPNAPKRTKSQCKAKAPPPPSSLDSPSEAIIQKEILKEDTQPEPTCQELYLSLDTINKTATESLPPPPIPPKTYQVIHRHGSNESLSKPASPAPPASRSSDQQPWSNTPPSRSTTQLVAHPKPSPVQAQDQIELKPGKNITIMLFTYTADIIHNNTI